MQLDSLALSILMSLSTLLGIQAVPDANGTGWIVEQAWTANKTTAEAGPSESSYRQLIASSTVIPEQCRKEPHSDIRFPMVVHGVHTISLDGHILLQTADPTFETIRSFYGSPVLKCSQLQSGAKLVWQVDSYTTYFARIGYFPKLVSYHPMHNVFAESIHVIGAGGALMMALFTLTIFLGKVPRALALSVSLSCLGASIYFANTVGGFLGLPFSMLTAHKIADVGVWLAISLIINAMRLEGLLSKRFYFIYLGNVLIGSLIILLGGTGDAVQLGTSLPFAASMVMLVILLVRVIRNRGQSKQLVDSGRLSLFKRSNSLHTLSLVSFVLACFNEMFVVLGLINSSPLLPLGFLCGVFFLALAVNEKIDATYLERDYLRENLEGEVTIKTQELTQKHAELEQAMSTLRNTQAELVQSAKLASLGTLSAGIAHEINNSLNYVNGALQPLEKIINASCRPEDKVKIDRLVGVMKEGLNLTLEIIKSLRNYTGLNQAKFNDVNLLSTVQSSLNILRSKIRGKIEVDLQVPEDLVVFGSVVGIGQVFMNLISNAIDAMSNGGKLTIEAVSDHENATIKIRDSGTGMSAETVARVFEPFFTTKSVGSGTGLGLHIVKGEIDRHKGSIQINSQLGEGTCFTIQFPRQTNDPALAARRTA